jgi:iron(III) transport system ATP-binding protein
VEWIVIEIDHLSRSVGGRKILDDVSLRAGDGRLLAILGPSGSGKTSLLRLIAGLDRPSRGEIRISGRTVSSPSCLVSPVDRNVSMVFQDLALWPHLTARGNIEFMIDRGRSRTKGEIFRKLTSLISMMCLTGYENRYPGELSGGEKQRLAIARALASEPQYLLMDEPFSNLDDVLKGEFLNMTRSLKERDRMTIVYVTHSIDEALFLADDMCVLAGGKKVKTWTGEEMQGLSREDVLMQAFGVKR